MGIFAHPLKKGQSRLFVGLYLWQRTIQISRIVPQESIDGIKNLPLVGLLD